MIAVEIKVSLWCLDEIGAHCIVRLFKKNLRSSRRKRGSTDVSERAE